jgi:DNA-binding transcriptional ArsR family regulator
MIDVMFDGRAHSVGELARSAGIARSTASEHLTRLAAAGVVVAEADGARRLYALAGEQVAIAVEALAALAPTAPASGLREWTRKEALREARTCYDHLAGRLGVAIADAAIGAGALDPDFMLGARADEWFSRLGVDLAALPPTRRPLLRVCTDWTEKREHLAGSLGAAICGSLLGAGWVVQRPNTRAVEVTPLGHARLALQGVQMTRQAA